MIADFVDRRGGGLLMLGGARSFGEGGYGGTPVADALPLAIDPRTRASEPSDVRAPEGRSRRVPARRTRRRRSRVPRRPRLRDGATCRRSPPSTPRFHSSRPPRCCSTAPTSGGRSAAGAGCGSSTAVARRSRFLAQDSWQWQMHASITLEDQTHENFWRQMLRWLVDDVPVAVEARTTTDRVEPGEAVTIEATVVDPTYVELNDAQRDGASHAAGRLDPRCAAAVDRRARRSVPRHVRQHRGGRVRSGRRRRPRRQADRQRRRATCAPVPATPSSSIRRCTKRRCGASPKRRGAASTRRRPSRASPRTCATRAAASPRSKSANSGTCRSS